MCYLENELNSCSIGMKPAKPVLSWIFGLVRKTENKEEQKINDYKSCYDANKWDAAE